MKELFEFLEPFNTKPVVWGEDDCTAIAATWVARRRKIEVSVPEYHSREEGLAMVAEFGSLVALWEDFIVPIGLMPVQHPEAGDIGVVQMTGYEVGMIFGTGGIGFWRADVGGFMQLRPRPRHILRAWRV